MDTGVNNQSLNIFFTQPGSEQAFVSDPGFILNTSEVQRANFFLNDAARAQFISSRILLKYVLSLFLKIEPAEIIIQTNQLDKPILPDYAIDFNVSHTGGMCMVAVSRSGPIGIDIEKIRPLHDLENLIEKNFTSAEQHIICKNENQKPENFFQLWTIKESFLKLTGLGMRLEPHKFEIDFAENSYLVREIENTKAYYKTVNAPAGYAAAMAQEKKELKHNQFIIH
ncbi:MAG: 4'-phosphopantetheinyl transferase superfamily protein [Crocinitomicaceae bacterium]|nr:4'-phosphopantetheinyl transferase superfamily protein [Crocinitomicaceae bacterium]